MTDTTILMPILEPTPPPESQPPKNRIWFRLAAAALLLCLAFVVFVPVRLTARYIGPVYAWEDIREEKVDAALVTLAGKRYPVKNCTRSSDAVGTEPAKIALKWGIFNGTLSLEPIPFAKYELEYSGKYYELDNLDEGAVRLSAVFEDGFSREMAPEEYRLKTTETDGLLTIRARSIYGVGEAGTVQAIRLRECRIDYPLPHEGQELQEKDFSATAIYEDDTQKPVTGSFSFTRETAQEKAQVVFTSRYGEFREPIQYETITSMETWEDPGLLTINYNDGSTLDIEPTDETSDYRPPVITSCTIRGENVILEVETDDRVECFYGAFVSSNISDGISQAAKYGSGKITMVYPYDPRDLADPIQVINASPNIKCTASNMVYLSNPEEVAALDFPYPEQPSKKGLQINPYMMEDVVELGTNHAVVNITLDSLIGEGVEYTYNRKAFEFNETYIQQLDEIFGALGENGIITSAVLLMRYTSDTIPLIYPSGRAKGHTYYGLNMTDWKAREILGAMFSMLADRYCNEEYLVLNWILGNEVNDYWSWNYCGLTSFDEYVDNYAHSFSILYNCVKAAYANAKIYIPLDHCWCYARSGTYTSKRLLDAFAVRMEQLGHADWQLAYHAYSEPLKNTRFWQRGTRVTDSVLSPIVTMSNLPVLTEYIKTAYGENHRVILSENGFSSTAGEQVQAAAIAYAYYLAENNDMVDAFMLQRHTDDTVETYKGLYFGLWYNDSGIWSDASRKKYAWEVFRDMDVAPESTAFALDIIGAKSWEELMPH